MFSWSKKPAGQDVAPSAPSTNPSDKSTPLVKLLGEAPPAPAAPQMVASPNLMGLKSQPASPPPQTASSKAPNGNPPPGAPPAGGSGNGDETIFEHAPPEGHAKKVSEVLGEIVWLRGHDPNSLEFGIVSPDKDHKREFIDAMSGYTITNASRSRHVPRTPVLLQQFRLFYAKDRPSCRRHARNGGVVLWAFVDDDTAGRLAAGTNKLRPQDWKSGDKVWSSRLHASGMTEVIAPFGGARAPIVARPVTRGVNRQRKRDMMLNDLKARVFPTREVRYVAVSADGKKDVRVV